MSLFSGGLNTLKSVQDEGLAGQQSSFEQSLGASFMEGINDTPVVRLSDWLRHETKSTEGDTLSPDDANARYGIKGVLSFDQPVSSALAQTLNAEKQNSLIRQNTIRNGPDGAISGILNTAAGALPSFLDPINYAAALIPGLGEERIGIALGSAAARAEGFGMERVADGLLSAEGLNRRVGAALSGSLPGRAVQGASQGTVGMAALEPLNMYLDRDEHNDWSAGQALGNIAFGGILGGSLHGLGYAFGKRLERAGTNAKGQLLADGLTSMASDSPSNAESLLNIHEIQNARNDLDRTMAEHGAEPDETTSQVPLRDRIADDLSQLRQSHADTLDEAALYERPDDEPEQSDNTAPQPAMSASSSPSSPSLFTFLIRHGGVLDEGGELRANDIHRQRIGLVRRNGGMSLDTARERAIEHGYLRPDADISDLLDAMVEESHGRKVFPNGEQSGQMADFSGIEDHHRERAADDADEAALHANITLTPEEHSHATDAILSGLHPDDAIEDALRLASHSTWDRYVSMMDEGRAVHHARIGAKQQLLHALTRQRLGLYARHLDADVDSLSLYDLAGSILRGDSPEDAVEHALRLIETEKGKGHDAGWQDVVQEAYQAAHQRLDELQQGAAEAIMRNLHGYEDHEVTQSRAGLSSQREAAPSPEQGQDVSPLPTGGIEHLDLSAAGSNPVMVGRMPSGIEGVPDWPVLVSDGEKAHTPYKKDGKTVYYATGRHHIMERHGHQMKASGFDDVDSYISHILKNANEVRLDERNGSYFIIVRGEKNTSSAKHDATVTELKKEDGYYLVKTAAPFKSGYLNKKTLLQEGRRTTPSDRNGQDHPLNPAGHMPDDQKPSATVGAEEASSGTLATGEDRNQEGKLLWDGSRPNLSHPAEKSANLPPSSPDKSGSDGVYTSSRHSSASDNGNPAPKSQAITEAQSYSDQIDRQLTALGDQISLDELAEIQREKDLSDGNADALTSAAACLTRKAP
ncbi:hypothetical protein NQF86_02735 [Bombella sp. TMW 2.2543]|uniref:Large polyvalent protein-associated domain-containing protein n=1 Tax=Bombella pluederhausensis TaxID=2967336 RepID=A0ABT3WEQ9_9PROT|nr:hypothetical protein [Bombella pluederhausensis]MCX5617590.1 hypothetical protein [Bombella pluederhausensis]